MLNRNEKNELTARMSIHLAMNLCPICCQDIFNMAQFRQGISCRLMSHYESVQEVAKLVNPPASGNKEGE